MALAFAPSFSSRSSFTGQVFDPPFVAGDQGFAFSFNNAIQQRFNLPVDLGYAALELGAARIAGGAFALRQGVQVPGKAFERFPVRCDLRDDRLETGFQVGAANRFPIAGAALGRAQVIRMLVAGLARGPAGRERRAAIGAEHKAAQGKIGADVFSSGRFGADTQALLDFFVGRERNQALMSRLAERGAPAWQFQVSGIKRLGQQVFDALIADFACGKVFRIVRLAFKKALDLDLRAEPARGKALQRFRDDGGQRFVADQDFSLSGHMSKAVSARSPKHPIAIYGAGAHAVFGLLGVLLALMLADRSQQVFDQDRVAVLPEFDGGTFEPGTGARNGFAQIEMGFDVPRKTADVVNDNHEALRARMFLEISEHSLHAGAGRYAAGYRFIDENPVHVIALLAGEFTAAGFLRS